TRRHPSLRSPRRARTTRKAAPHGGARRSAYAIDHGTRQARPAATTESCAPSIDYAMLPKALALCACRGTTPPYHRAMPKTDPIEENPPKYTLSQLTEVLGEPDAKAIDALMDDDAAKSAFIDIGAQIASARILTDAHRILPRAYEFYSTATAEQKNALVGI